MIIQAILTVGVFVANIHTAPHDVFDENVKQALPCDPALCKLPDCYCSSTKVPLNLNQTQIPQLVYFTFDDAVTKDNFAYYQTFFNKTNPDGCPVGVTYYVSHEYADYSKVHELHAHGHEIALHSITHNVSTDYWQHITIDGLRREFWDERTLIAHFANIPENDMKGLRLPFLQLCGDTSYQFIKDYGLEYDCSWPTLFNEPGLWPYTLDYRSMQDCPIGPCPNEAIPGVWVAPMLDWIDLNGFPCSFVDACAYVPTGEEELFAWILQNFNRQYEGTRAPFGFFLHAAWFVKNPMYFQVYTRFVDYLQQLDDVYVVSVSRALEWARNPKTLDTLHELWPACQPTYTPNCQPITCELKKGEEFRYMTMCATNCPNAYPWLDDPLGLGL